MKPGQTEAPCEHCEGGIAIAFTDAQGVTTLQHGCDRPVERWSVVAGFVHVEGEAVLDAKGGPIKPRATCNLTCQRCKQVNVEAPLALYRRFEFALGRQMYWFGLIAGAWGKYRFCKDCPGFGS